jgi:pimeloyl-ACP methyl ester carboxylesterase
MTEFLDIKGGRIAYDVTSEGPLIALIRHLGGGPGAIVGHSLSGGAATIAAATAPDLVSGIVEVCPFTRKVEYSLGGMLRVGRYRRGALLMAGVALARSLKMWMGYLDLAYPESRPTTPPTWRRYAPSCPSPGGWPSSSRP